MKDFFHLRFGETEQIAHNLQRDAQDLYNTLQRLQQAVDRLFTGGLQAAFVDELQQRVSFTQNILRTCAEETEEAGTDLKTVVELARSLDNDCMLLFSSTGDTVPLSPTETYIDHMKQYAIKQEGASCSLTSQVMILNALGIDVTVDQVFDEAFLPAAISGYDFDSLLNHYGIETEGYSQFWWMQKDESQAVDWLKQRLDNQQPVIVGLEADKLYRAIGGNDNNLPIDGHAVIVLGTETQNGQLYYKLLDPAYGMVTMSTEEDFLEAWGARGYSATAAKDSVAIPAQESGG